MNNNKSIFAKKPYSMLLAASTSVVWAFAFPLIKLGIAAFNIDSSDTGAKTLFAGVRFFAAGVIVLSASLISHRPSRIKRKSDLLLALLLGVVNTALHYFCYYIGLSNQSGSRSAVIDSLGSFLLILAACAAFHDEHLTRRKILGCVLGFGGILLVNAGGLTGDSTQFSFMGDGMLALSAAFFAVGGIITRVVTTRIDSVIATGISLGSGGLLLVAAGWLMGGRLGAPQPVGIVILLCLIGISTYGFSVYNALLSCNPVGDIAIFNSLIPILGVTFSCMLLHEPFRLHYAAAGILVACGIFIINSRKEA